MFNFGEIAEFNFDFAAEIKKSTIRIRFEFLIS